jgi:hypothetical protein
LGLPIHQAHNVSVSFSFPDDGVHIERILREAYADDYEKYSEDQLHTQ